MCRVLTYLGKPTSIAKLVVDPDSALIKQSYDPKHMSHILNLAGFGMAAWIEDSPDEHLPLMYKSDVIPVYDKNIPAIGNKIKTNCLLAHVRGVPFSHKQTLGKQNVHPFMFHNTNLAFAHNGSLPSHMNIRNELLSHIKPEFSNQIHGNTDTELMYGMLMSLLKEPYFDLNVEDVASAVETLYEMLADIRKKHKHFTVSPNNFFITNGKFLVVTRFVFDYGSYLTEENQGHISYHSLWYTFGEEYGCFDDEYKMKGGKSKHSVIFASEPLTNKVSTWIEVPEYSLVTASYVGDEINIQTRDLDI